MKVPRLQILTAAQFLDGRRPQVPFGFTEGFKQAEREAAPTTQGPPNLIGFHSYTAALRRLVLNLLAEQGALFYADRCQYLASDGYREATDLAVRQGYCRVRSPEASQ